jgi:hypothetical protein
MFNFWQVSVFLSINIYSFLYDIRIFAIWASIFAAYTLMGALQGHNNLNGIRKTIRIGSWDVPREGNIYLKQEIDVTDLEIYLEKLNKDRDSKGLRPITMSHISLKALGQAMKAKPEDFGKIVWGK